MWPSDLSAAHNTVVGYWKSQEIHNTPEKDVRGFIELGCSGLSSTGAGEGQLHRNQGPLLDGGLERARQQQCRNVLFYLLCFSNIQEIFPGGLCSELTVLKDGQDLPPSTCQGEGLTQRNWGSHSVGRVLTVCMKPWVRVTVPENPENDCISVMPAPGTGEEAGHCCLHIQSEASLYW